MLRITLRHWPVLQWNAERVPTRSLGWIALLISILAGSTYNAFAKILTGSLSPLTLFFLSELLTGFFVLLSFGCMPVIRSLFRLPRKMFGPLLLVGLMSGTIAPLLLFTGLRMSTAVNASLFANMEPVFLIILAVIVLHESFGRWHVMSSIIVSTGVVLVALRGFTTGVAFNPGDLLLVLSGFCFATGSIIFRKKLRHCKPHLVLFARATVAISCFFLFSPFIQHPLIEEIQLFPLAAVPVLLGFSFISRFLNVFGFYEALDRLPVTTVSLTNNLGIFTSILFAWWLLGEPLSWYHAVGGVLIVSGTLLLEISGTHPTKKHLEHHHRTRGPRA